MSRGAYRVRRRARTAGVWEHKCEHARRQRARGSARCAGSRSLVLARAALPPLRRARRSLQLGKGMMPSKKIPRAPESSALRRVRSEQFAKCPVEGICYEDGGRAAPTRERGVARTYSKNRVAAAAPRRSALPHVAGFRERPRRCPRHFPRRRREKPAALRGRVARTYSKNRVAAAAARRSESPHGRDNGAAARKKARKFTRVRPSRPARRASPRSRRPPPSSPPS